MGETPDMRVIPSSLLERALNEQRGSWDKSSLWQLPEGRVLAFVADAPQDAPVSTGLWVQRCLEERHADLTNLLPSLSDEEVKLLVADLVTEIGDHLFGRADGLAQAALALVLSSGTSTFIVVVGDCSVHLVGETYVRISDTTRLSSRSIFNGTQGLAGMSATELPVDNYVAGVYVGTEPRVFKPSEVITLPTENIRLIALASDGVERQFGAGGLAALMTAKDSEELFHRASTRLDESGTLLDDFSLLAFEPRSSTDPVRETISDLRASLGTVQEEITKLDTEHTQLKGTIHSEADRMLDESQTIRGLQNAVQSQEKKLQLMEEVRTELDVLNTSIKEFLGDHGKLSNSMKDQIKHILSESDALARLREKINEHGRDLLEIMSLYERQIKLSEKTDKVVCQLNDRDAVGRDLQDRIASLEQSRDLSHEDLSGLVDRSIKNGLVDVERRIEQLTYRLDQLDSRPTVPPEPALTVAHGTYPDLQTAEASTDEHVEVETVSSVHDKDREPVQKSFWQFRSFWVGLLAAIPLALILAIGLQRLGTRTGSEESSNTAIPGPETEPTIQPPESGEKIAEYLRRAESGMSVTEIVEKYPIATGFRKDQEIRLPAFYLLRVPGDLAAADYLTIQRSMDLVSDCEAVRADIPKRTLVCSQIPASLAKNCPNAIVGLAKQTIEVPSGATWGTIAQQFGTTPNQLMGENPDMTTRDGVVMAGPGLHVPGLKVVYILPDEDQHKEVMQQLELNPGEGYFEHQWDLPFERVWHLHYDTVKGKDWEAIRVTRVLPDTMSFAAVRKMFGCSIEDLTGTAAFQDAIFLESVDLLPPVR